MGDKIYGETPEDGIVARVYSDEELAARFVACHNACAGIPTDQLGDVKALIEALEQIEEDTAATWVAGVARAALASFRKN